MKIINFSLLVIAFFLTVVTKAQVAINIDGSAPNASAMLDVVSTSKGFLAPRMTQAQRNLISSPAIGLMIFQTDNVSGFYFNSGTPSSPVWSLLSSGSSTETDPVVRAINGIVKSNGTTISKSNLSEPLNLLTFSTSGATTLTLPTSGTVTALGNSVTGSGNIVLATSPTLVTPTINKIANLTSNGLVQTTAGDGTLSIVTLPLSVANGGTGSSTSSFVDLTTTQTVGGAKTWNNLGTFNAGLNAIGAAINLNANSNFAVNINTGTSNGAINIANGTTGGNTITIGNNVGATGITQRVGTGNFTLDGAATSNYNIGGSTTSGTITIGGTGLNTGAISIGTGTGVQTLNFGTGGTGIKTINIGTGAAANTILIGNTKANTSTGINVTTPTAQLQLGAGYATASNGAPLKFTSGTNLTTPEDGAVEYDGTNYYVTSGSTRYTLAKTLTITASLNFGNTPTNTSSDLTVTITGAALNDVVILGIPNSAVNNNTCFSGWVSAANTVKVRFNNYSSAAVNPGLGTFRITVLKY